MSKPKLTLVLFGFETLVDAFIKRKEKIEALQQDQDNDEAVIIAEARAAKISAEKAGAFHKSVQVLGKKLGDLCVVFANRFGEIDISNAGLLRMLMAPELYGECIQCKVKLTAKTAVSKSQLQAELGEEAFDKLVKLFDLTEYLAPTAEFLEARAMMRPVSDEGTNEQVDQLIEHVQAKPQVRVQSK